MGLSPEVNSRTGKVTCPAGGINSGLADNMAGTALACLLKQTLNRPALRTNGDWLAECNSLFRFRSALVERGSTAARLRSTAAARKFTITFRAIVLSDSTHERSATDSNTSLWNLPFLKLAPSPLNTVYSLVRHSVRCSSRTRWICRMIRPAPDRKPQSQRAVSQ